MVQPAIYEIVDVVTMRRRFHVRSLGRVRVSSAWSSKMIRDISPDISRFHLTKRCLDAEHDAPDVRIDDDHHV
jgi:hypothetical protein